MSTISIMTDFGPDDWRAGAMKGIVYDIYPSARMVDVTHDVKNHSVEVAASILFSSYSHFSYGSIHVAAVHSDAGDPASPILLESRGHYFIGPDNGIFTPVDHPTSALYALDKKQYWRPSNSTAFPPLDIFAPVAAYLARGVPPDQLGTRLNRGIARMKATKVVAGAFTFAPNR